MQNQPNLVGIYQSSCMEYPCGKNLFSPSTNYPEYIFDHISDENNDVYDSIRKLFVMMEYDKTNYGKQCWNPLGFLIKPGDTVLLKPNMVLHKNENVNFSNDCLVTNGSITRVVADFALIALKGTGKLIIGDASMHATDFEFITKEQKYNEITEFYKIHGVSTDISVCDLRNYSTKNGKIAVDKAEGYIVELGESSEFFGLPNTRYRHLRVGGYATNMTLKYHTLQRNAYQIGSALIKSDVVINLPKPKTHRFAGVTIAMKNFIGIVANKETAPHYSVGSKESGNGDEYQSSNFIKRIYTILEDYMYNLKRKNKNIVLVGFIFRQLGRICKLLYSTEYPFHASGSRNDTLWRSILDLNKIVYFADKNGVMQNTQQRKILTIADMIIAGEGEGPLAPSPKPLGVIAIGENTACFDEVIATLMGFDTKIIPQIKNLKLMKKDFNFSHIDKALIISNLDSLNYKSIYDIKKYRNWEFKPHSKWSDIVILNNTGK